jgi:pSer/pThr/pTyr-binding forkhead associated (FHA) protein
MILHLQHQRSDGDVDTYHLKPGRRYHIGRGSACEVRILDLKMSRKHAAVEYQDQAWRFIDLCSTNGCKLDGEMVTGTVLLPIGSAIEVGGTVLQAHRLVSVDEDPDALGPVAPAPKAAAVPVVVPSPVRASKPGLALDDQDGPQSAQDIATSALTKRSPSEQPTLTAFDPITVPPPAKPQPVKPVKIQATPSESLDLMPPAREPVAPAALPQPEAPRKEETSRKVRPVVIRSGTEALLEAVVPAAVSPASAPAMDVLATEERSFFITVLGRRIGPLNRTQARELKARELKGALSSADLDQYPAA